MNKQQLTNKLATDLQLTKVKAEKAINLLFNTVADELRRGNKIELRGCCTFSVTKWPARKTVHPQSGKRIFIPAKTNIKFKASKSLIQKVKGKK